MIVHLYDLDFHLGSPIPIPDYIKKNKNIVSLDGVENNMCFWRCLAIALGSRRDKCSDKSIELFNEYYGNFHHLNEKQLKEKYQNYIGIGTEEINDLEE